MNKKIKIVADSSSDVFFIADVEFESAPLKIITDEKQYVDNDELDAHQMATYLQNYKGKSSTSCPNVDDWLSAFGDAEEIYCVTITSTLSGSNNTARIAAETYIEEHPERRVFVLDSLSTGPEMGLMIDKLRELILEEKSFETVCDEITQYTKTTGLLFVLESMKNLANNGRVSSIAAKMAGILGIRAIGKASDRGDLEMLDKCRGEKKALETIILRLRELGLRDGKVKIGHCSNESAARTLEELIIKEFTGATVEVYRCRGLCTFYAEMGGLLIGFEKA